MASKVSNRLKIKRRIRKTINGTSALPRLSVFKSNNAIYCQLIDDLTGNTLASSSSKQIGEKGVNLEVSNKVGKALAEKAKAKNISQVVFDRNGFIYHGRIKALADGARDGGLKF